MSVTDLLAKIDRHIEQAIDGAVYARKERDDRTEEQCQVESTTLQWVRAGLAKLPENPDPYWRCFHCGEVFDDPAEAALHFGESERKKPVCELDVEYVRDLELQVWRYQEDDTDLHRQIAELRSEMSTATRRAEELGYSRGLRDAKLIGDDNESSDDKSTIRVPDREW